MIPLISIFILSSLDPIKNFVSLKTYMTNNAHKFCQSYHVYIEEDMIIKKDKLVEDSLAAFFEYLDTIGIEHTFDGKYYFFKKKEIQ